MQRSKVSWDTRVLCASIRTTNESPSRITSKKRCESINVMCEPSSEMFSESLCWGRPKSKEVCSVAFLLTNTFSTDEACPIWLMAFVDTSSTPPAGMLEG